LKNTGVNLMNMDELQKVVMDDDGDDDVSGDGDDSDDEGDFGDDEE